jgi:hypothetical protein
MSLLARIGRELLGLFVDDGFLAVGLLVVVAAAASMSILIPAAAGGILVVGPAAILLLSVLRIKRNQGS